MMERPVVRAEMREGTGKGTSRKLRAKGFIPAVFYGSHARTIPLTVDPKELLRSLQTEAGGNVLIDLEIRQDDQSERKVVMVKELQFDALQKKPLHTDFYEVAMDVFVTVEVPIHLVGKPEGTKMGGILEQVRRAIEIECLPGDIPKSIDIDVSSLKIGDSVHVKGVQVEKAKILTEANFTIATVVPPLAEEKKAEEIAVEAPEGTEGKEKEEKE